ncbi:hypothetical protein [Arthrobacter sp. ISL-28]|uniref:hypothetical protein n=1 Tax=Arthrobacter sp. ISL-28 TaxID=2819108 RepID=UPI001BEAD17A|nr:hypothetical protein [Arthrobacter sp. ISL-28]MBT2521816.1 hypothetical protein [Arthrobacter sp. ISL-28]
MVNLFRWASIHIANEALAVHTPIPTPDGWTTMGELQAGDMIYGTTGKPVTVAEAFSVQAGRDCFRVTFLDGTSVIASDGHLWKAKPSGWPKQYNRVWTTRQMYEHKAKRWAIPIPGPQERPERDLPMDPYLLGYWLGDGSTAGCNITVGDEDLEAFTANMTEIGVTVRPVGTKKGAANRMTFSDKTGFGANMGGEQARALRLLPCYRDKHIPEEYFLASIDQRIALLQGLLDSDGCAAKPGIIFVGRERLSRDVFQLLSSLGERPTIAFRADARSRDGGTWRVSFNPRYVTECFRLARKQAKVVRATRTETNVASIEPVESVPVRCIRVDAEDSLFQAGESCQLTHNTPLDSGLARARVPRAHQQPEQGPGPVVVHEREHGRRAVRVRLLGQTRADSFGRSREAEHDS